MARVFSISASMQKGTASIRSYELTTTEQLRPGATRKTKAIHRLPPLLLGWLSHGQLRGRAVLQNIDKELL
jgi:hypothetical protein